MKYLIVVGVLGLTGCSVVERLLDDPEVIAPVVEKAALAVAAPSLITITDALIAVVAAATGAAGVSCAHKLRKAT